MKKLMIAAAIAMTAVCSQAVTVNWSIGLLNGPKSASDGTVGSTSLKTTIGNWTATLYIYDALGQDVIASDTSTMITYLDGTRVKRSFTNGATWDADVGLLTSSEFTDVAATTAYQYKLIVEGTGIEGSYDASKELALTAFTSDGAAVPTMINAGTVTGWPSQKWEVASIPEPTSGLLLLLGVAGLALRRRRA